MEAFLLISPEHTEFNPFVLDTMHSVKPRPLPQKAVKFKSLADQISLINTKIKITYFTQALFHLQYILFFVDFFCRLINYLHFRAKVSDLC